MTPARLLLYGGTFDPPHVGHVNNLRAALPAPVRRLICENDLYGLGAYLKNP